MKEKLKVVIIGGGAAGFFTAVNIADKVEDAEVIILEKTSKLLSKVKVSGGGRCNVTHGCFVPKELIENYPRGKKELLGPFHTFMTGDTLEWFSNKGVDIVMEEDGRMFPASNSSQTIINCFLSEVKRLGIKIIQNCTVLEIVKKEKLNIVTDKKSVFEADFVVASNGGHPKLKHYQLFENLGHSIISPIPSLFTFNLPKHSSNKLMGLAIPATVKIIGTKLEAYGPLLFTHWGMSGPGILKLSSLAADFLYKKSYQFNYQVTWLDNAEEFVVSCRKKLAKQKVKNIKIEGFPNRFLQYLLERSEIDISKNWADLSKAEIEALIMVLEFDKYTANGKTTFKEEFVTCGGIDLKEVNMKTLESKKVDNLFFSGEILNIDAVTGGFNFQAAWTTGFLVASEIARRLES